MPLSLRLFRRLEWILEQEQSNWQSSEAELPIASVTVRRWLKNPIHNGEYINPQQKKFVEIAKFFPRYTDELLRMFKEGEAKNQALPDLASWIVGRENESKELRQYLNSIYMHDEDKNLRENESKKLRQYPKEERRRIYHGWAGVGKTSFLGKISHDKQIQEIFYDGILWASLGENPNLQKILETWAGELNLALPEGNLVKSVEIFQKHLDENRCYLLLIDDFYRDSDLQIFWSMISSRNRCCLVATTRFTGEAEKIAYPDTQKVIHLLDILSYEDADRLLQVIIPQVLTAFPDKMDQLLKSIQRLPLAIHIAARLLLKTFEPDHTVTLATEDLLDSLISDCGQLLEQTAPRDRYYFDENNIIAPTLRSLLERTTKYLNAGELECFAALSLFSSEPFEFQKSALIHVWDIHSPEKMLQRLVDYGLVQAARHKDDPDWYWQHAVIKAHAKFIYKTVLAEENRQ